MSFVISVLRSNYGIIAGDTQLNKDNEKFELTGMKVVPVSDNMVIGFTGLYLEAIAAIKEFTEKEVNSNFIIAVNDLKKSFQNNCPDGNAIIVKNQNGSIKYAVLDGKKNWNFSMFDINSNNTEIKLLLPPDVKEDFCKPFFLSPFTIKKQAVDCIKAVSKVSGSVNDMVYGVEIKNGVIYQFTDGIDIMDIDYKHNKISDFSII